MQSIQAKAMQNEILFVCRIGFMFYAVTVLFGLNRYTLAAQDLVMRARGVLKDRGWRISNDRLGSGDDISVYVIPLIHGNKQS